MITPGFSLTATERVLPKLALDFTTASLDNRVTYTIGTTATVVNSSGIIQYAPHNLVTYSQDFTQADWHAAASNITVTASATTAPDGTNTGSKLVVNNATSSSNVFQVPTVSANSVYSFSFYLKKAEWNYAAIEARGNGSDAKVAWFDLNTGTVGTVQSGITASIVDVGDGWYRCIVSRTMGADVSNGRFRCYPTNADNSFSTGNGTSGIYAWGAQINKSNILPYYLTTTAFYYGPRFDYTLNTGGACKGLLIEESRTNLIAGSTGSGGAVIGTATVTLNNTTAPNGLTEATLLSGIASGASNGLRFRISGTTAGYYTCTLYVKGTSNSIGQGMRAYFEGNGGTYQSFGTLDTTLTSSWQRITITGNSTGASTFLDFVCSRGSVAQASEYYIWGAQMEAGAFPTSCIPTTTTALTRNADVAIMTGANFNDWWAATSGAANVSVIPESAVGTKPLFQVDDNTANNIISLRGNVANPELYIKATTDQVQIDAGTIVADTAYKLAGAWNTNNCAAAQNGAAAVTDTSATIPTVTQARIGSDGTNYANAWLQKINYWPQRITNNETQAFSK